MPGAGRSLFYWGNRSKGGTADTCTLRFLNQVWHHMVSELGTNKLFFVLFSMKSNNHLQTYCPWPRCDEQMEQIPLCSGVGKHLQKHFHFQRKKVHYLSPLSEERNFTHSILSPERKVSGSAWSYWGKKKALRHRWDHQWRVISTYEDFVDSIGISLAPEDWGQL